MPDPRLLSPERLSDFRKASTIPLRTWGGQSISDLLEHIDAQAAAIAVAKTKLEEATSKLDEARKALKGMLPLAQKLFNNTVSAARERGAPLQPDWVTFDDLTFVKASRAVLSDAEPTQEQP
jgi:hypothetical protein